MSRCNGHEPREKRIAELDAERHALLKELCACEAERVLYDAQIRDLNGRIVQLETALGQIRDSSGDKNATAIAAGALHR